MNLPDILLPELRQVFFDNEKIVREELKAESVGTVFKHLKEEVNLYYGESN